MIPASSSLRLLLTISSLGRNYSSKGRIFGASAPVIQDERYVHTLYPRGLHPRGERYLSYFSGLTFIWTEYIYIVQIFYVRTKYSKKLGNDVRTCHHVVISPPRGVFPPSFLLIEA
uniref:Uncharacterized protein n=1 Tax=Ditylum brightwellii TaxID=49249 RepID=A0A6U3V395_9STRA